MNFFDKLPRIYTICTWAAAILGAALLAACMKTVIQCGVAFLVFLVLILAYMFWDKKVARLIARSLCLLTLVAMGVLFAVYAVIYAQDIRPEYIVEPEILPGNITCRFATPLLCWLLPAVHVLAEKGGRYDAWVLRLLYTCLAVLAYICCFELQSGLIPWYFEPEILRYGWVVLLAVGCGLCWLCTYLRFKKKK